MWKIRLFVIAMTFACLQREGSAMIFRPEKGAMWDPSVLWHDGKYYAFMMYNKDGRKGLKAGHCLLATSTNGVHWEDQGAIIDERGRPDGATFYKCFVGKCGDKFIMNHGVARKQGQDLMRFYQSKDLRNWEYIATTEPDDRWYTRGRWDHMYMLPKEEGKPEAGYWSFPVAVPKQGVEDGKEHTFRLLCRMEMFELYIDDMLMQTYARQPGSGKVGFLVCNAQAEFSNLSAWSMSFPAEAGAKTNNPDISPVAKYEAVIKSQDKAVFGKAALELRRWMEVHDPHRPAYHTMGPLDFTFDVNGPIYHDGKYHLFYLNGKNPKGCHRGHLVSTDLVHWDDWPVAMWPDTPWDHEAVFSGNLVIDDKGTPTFIYTGNSSHQTAKGVLARSSDGMLTWQKKLVMDKPPYPGTPVHWDGQIWKDGGTWYQLCGGTYSNAGAAVLWSSPDLENWTYRNRIYATGKYGRFWELPYLLPFGEKSVLIIGVCPVRYWVGTYDKSSCVFKPDEEEADILDVSPHFYAPNPHMVDDKGPGGSQRRLMFGWVRGGKTPTKEVPYWDGNHSIPRVLTLEANKLMQKPIPELQLLRREHMQVKNRVIESAVPGVLKDFTGNAVEVVASFDPKGATAKRFGVKLRTSKDGKEQTVVYYEPATGRLGVAGAVVDGEISDKADFPAGQTITLHIFLDRSVVEVFAAGRVITKRTYSDPAGQGLDVFSDGGSVNLESLDVWRMKGIWD